jgi:hypothetical protein
LYQIIDDTTNIKEAGMVTGTDFLDTFSKGSIRIDFVIKGLVKKSDEEGELLFSRNADSDNWAKIPTSVVKDVLVLNVFSKNNQTIVSVQLHLKVSSVPLETVY